MTVRWPRGRYNGQRIVGGRWTVDGGDRCDVLAARLAVVWSLLRPRPAADLVDA